MIDSSSLSSSRGALLALGASLSLMPCTSLAEGTPRVVDSALIKSFNEAHAAVDAKLKHQGIEDMSLTHAILMGHEDIANMIIDAGTDVNLTNDSQQTPLMLACFLGNEQLVQRIIAASCKLDECDDAGNTALLYACLHYKNKPALVEMLLQAGAKPEACDESGNSALAKAFNQDDGELLELFLSKVDRESTDLKRTLATAMSMACRAGKLERVKKLVSLGASVVCYEENNSSSSPLQTAIHTKNLELLKYLLEQGAGDWRPPLSSRCPYAFTFLRGMRMRWKLALRNSLS